MIENRLDIATTRSVTAKRYKNRTVSWGDFVKRLRRVRYTDESVKEYHASSKRVRDEIKSGPGYFGGRLIGGLRRPQNVDHRQIVTLDLDDAPADFWEAFTMLYDFTAVLHSTHSHRKTAPRYRLIFPLAEPVKSDQYEAIARAIAGRLGIEYFDPTTFQPYRMMFWPSAPHDADFVFEEHEGEWCDPDEILDYYTDWRDVFSWPSLTDLNVKASGDVKLAEDPLEKPGLIGAFCRTYSIQDAIAEFLSDIYEPIESSTPGQRDRYTYALGSSFGGAIVYEDKFLYSHHGTDPAHGHAQNAFDLVRIHKFGTLDGPEDKGGVAAASYKRMMEWVAQDNSVKKQLHEDRKDRMQGLLSMLDGNPTEGAELLPAVPAPQNDEGPEDYLPPLARAGASLLPSMPAPRADWETALAVTKGGDIKPTSQNIMHILANDPALRGCFCYNDFDARPYVMRPVPWLRIEEPGLLNDVHEAGLRMYLDQMYGITGVQKVQDALLLTLHTNKFNAVQDYLYACRRAWDGVMRIDETLVKYFGAADTTYSRVAVRKFFVGAVARALSPGCKFDLVLTLSGEQGMLKSTFFNKLGGSWFSDSFMGVQGKEAYEQLQGSWIIEIAELSGLSPYRMDLVKHFLTKRIDSFRPAYGRHMEDRPRQCVFVGTTNEDDFLRDSTGNRRFLPVRCGVTTPELSVSDDLTRDEVAQLWGEAVQLYLDGEPLYLEGEQKVDAERVQSLHMDVDARMGIIQEFLDTPIPANWEDMTLNERRFFFNDPEQDGQKLECRKYVCAMEIWAECLGKPAEDLGRKDSKMLTDVLRVVPGWSEGEGTRRFGAYGPQRYFERDDD